MAISKVIFKLRVISPRSRDAPIRNKAHIEYIGKRKGVALNEDRNHGLFGSLQGKQATEFENSKDISNYISEKTKQNTNTYRAIISLKEEDAIRLGYSDKEKWEELVKTKLVYTAEQTRIPIQNLEYVAAVHMEKGHPHVHIMFWDKAQEIKNPFVHPSVANKIRVDLTKHIFEEELSQLQQIKNIARSTTTKKLGGFFDDFLETFANMTPAEYQSAMESLKQESDLADERLIYSRFPTRVIASLTKDLLELKEALPKKGRLSMKLLPPESKAQVHQFVIKILDNNVDCNREFQKYISTNVEIAQYFSDDTKAHAKAAKTAYDDMLDRLSNVVLKSVKKINDFEKRMDYKAQSEKYYHALVENLLTEVFGILTRNASADENKLHRMRSKGELSKEAKKELAKKLEHTSGIDWEQY